MSATALIVARLCGNITFTLKHSVEMSAKFFADSRILPSTACAQYLAIFLAFVFAPSAHVIVAEAAMHQCGVD